MEGGSVSEPEGDGDDWSGYESGPFCRHWGDPSDCDKTCLLCGHCCYDHEFGNGDACMVGDCECEKWREREERE